MLLGCAGCGSASAAKDSYEAPWGGSYFEVHLGLRIEKEISSFLFINKKIVLTKINKNIL